jgi:hypothetical protein
MPFKSKAQQRWMFAAESRGEVAKGTAKEWAHATKSIKALPDHAKKKKHKKKASEIKLFQQAGLVKLSWPAPQQSQPQALGAPLLQAQPNPAQQTQAAPTPQPIGASQQSPPGQPKPSVIGATPPTQASPHLQRHQAINGMLGVPTAKMAAVRNEIYNKVNTGRIPVAEALAKVASQVKQSDWPYQGGVYGTFPGSGGMPGGMGMLPPGMMGGYPGFPQDPYTTALGQLDQRRRVLSERFYNGPMTPEQYQTSIRDLETRQNVLRQETYGNQGNAGRGQPGYAQQGARQLPAEYQQQFQRNQAAHDRAVELARRQITTPGRLSQLEQFNPQLFEQLRQEFTPPGVDPMSVDQQFNDYISGRGQLPANNRISNEVRQQLRQFTATSPYVAQMRQQPWYNQIPQAERAEAEQNWINNQVQNPSLQQVQGDPEHQRHLNAGSQQQQQLARDVEAHLRDPASQNWSQTAQSWQQYWQPTGTGAYSAPSQPAGGSSFAIARSAPATNATSNNGWSAGGGSWNGAASAPVAAQPQSPPAAQIQPQQAAQAPSQQPAQPVQQAPASVMPTAPSAPTAARPVPHWTS